MRVMTISPNPALDLSISLDNLRLAELNRAQSIELQAAGKGVNAARVLVALGHQVTVTGFLGADNDAAFVRAFSDMGVEDDFLRIPGATRINAKLSEANGNVTDINAPGLEVDEHGWQRLIEHIEARLNYERPDALMIGGSLPPGLPSSAMGSMVKRLRTYGVPLWVDTSGAALSAAVSAGANAVKPNREELAEWAEQPIDDEDALHRAALSLYGQGIEESVVSDGARGVTWVSARGVWQALPPKVAVANTVCAGDTLFAAMLHAVLSGMSPDEGLRLATALSAEAVRHVGVGDMTASDFSDLLDDTRVRRLNDAVAGGALA